MDKIADDVKLKMSFLQLYNEKFYDILVRSYRSLQAICKTQTFPENVLVRFVEMQVVLHLHFLITLYIFLF